MMKGPFTTDAPCGEETAGRLAKDGPWAESMCSETWFNVGNSNE